MWRYTCCSTDVVSLRMLAKFGKVKSNYFIVRPKVCVWNYKPVNKHGQQMTLASEFFFRFPHFNSAFVHTDYMYTSNMVACLTTTSKHIVYLSSSFRYQSTFLSVRPSTGWSKNAF